MRDANITAVLTACIRPGDNMAAHIRRMRPEERIQDYRAALTSWLRRREPRITQLIFIDNSGHPLEELEAHAREQNEFGRRCEFISLPFMPLPDGLHHGYLELKLMDEGFARSRLFGATPHFLKATGRYRFPAISRLLDRLPEDFHVAVDSRDNRFFVRHPQRFTGAALMLFSTAYYDGHLRTLYRKMRPAPPPRHQFIEDMLFDFLAPHRGEEGYVLRWPVNCDPEGICANGESWNSGRRRLFALGRGAGRRLMPAWWF